MNKNEDERFLFGPGLFVVVPVSTACGLVAAAIGSRWFPLFRIRKWSGFRHFCFGYGVTSLFDWAVIAAFEYSKVPIGVDEHGVSVIHIVPGPRAARQDIALQRTLFACEAEPSYARTMLRRQAPVN